MAWLLAQGDCLYLPLRDNSVDLVFCSPPYEAQRAYGELDFDLAGEEWVAWAIEGFAECLRVCRGLVAWVVEGETTKFNYSATPFLLVADLKRRGVPLRKPCVYRRNGIPGSGGPDFLRNDWEVIVCASKSGKLPWSDNTALGSRPKYNRPRSATNRRRDGTRADQVYRDPVISNPGNVIECTVGKGHLGWSDAHDNEAPFPQKLAEIFVRTFCPPGGIVLDPFSGSGTTVAAAEKWDRQGLGLDLRQSQAWLGQTRLMGLRVTERRNGQRLLL
jgi:hypothetical protein